MTNTDYKAGDRVWVVFDRGADPRYLTIEKVGRKWVTIRGPRQWRFLVAGGQLEEVKYGKIGVVFNSRHDWISIEAEKETKKVLLNKFKFRFDSPLTKLPLHQLQAIDTILESGNHA